MKPSPADIWNHRFSQKEYAYGDTPNEYLKEQLKKLVPGKILFPAEGEGRNAVFAAKNGWAVSAYDISVEGKKKAEQLAQKNNVTIDYQVGALDSLHYSKGTFDVIALIYAHFINTDRVQQLKQLNCFLKSGGVIIFEAFSKNHLAYRKLNVKVGGPDNIDLLFSIDEIKSAFADFEIIELKEQEITLQEGLYHNGIGSVIRFVGKKI